MSSRLESRRSVLVTLSEKTVLLYRRLAPERVRVSCRFEPSCSEYALLAFRKDGFLVGWRKAFGRLVRCRPPHGGVDMP
jgi:putative component of membrane protein insertase Oxa1/YidC/SpoIIIJ protein YidD